MKTEKVIAAGVLPICKATGRILLVRRGFNQSGSGKWACFGGKFEQDDKDLSETALREFVEESGIEANSRFQINH